MVHKFSIPQGLSHTRTISAVHHFYLWCFPVGIPSPLTNTLGKFLESQRLSIIIIIYSSGLSRLYVGSILLASANCYVRYVYLASRPLHVLCNPAIIPLQPSTSNPQYCYANHTMRYRRCGGGAYPPPEPLVDTSPRLPACIRTQASPKKEELDPLRRTSD